MHRVHDPDLEVDELEPLDLGVRPAQRLAQRVVERVDRTVALPGRDRPDAARGELDGRLSGRPVGGAGEGLDDDPPALDVEVREPLPVDLLAQQQLEGGVRGVVGVALRLGVLDAHRHPAEQLVLPREVHPELAPLELDRRAARHLGDQHPHVVADPDRVDVLVEVRIDPDGAGVQPGLVRERTGADVRLARERADVRDLADRVRDPGGLAQSPARAVEQVAALLDLEVGDDGDQVGVAGTLAVPVDRALDVRGARAHGREGVRHRAAGVVVRMHAEPQAVPDGGAHLRDDVRHAVGQHPAVGVAQRHDLGPRRERGPDRLDRVGRVVAEAVEEVLGVEHDAAALADEELDGVRDHREVLRTRRAQGALDVADVALGDQRHDRRLRVQEGAHLRVVPRASARLAGGAERREHRVGQVQFLGRPREELRVLRDRPGPATLDEPDPQLVEERRNRELVCDGQVHALLLGAVAQGGVVDVELRERLVVAGHDVLSV